MKNFKDCGYAILDVFDYKKIAWELAATELFSTWGTARLADKWLEKDIAGLVRQGNNVVVEHSFLV